jgi:hypothetical protein
VIGGVNSVGACAWEVFVSSVQLGENLHGRKEIICLVSGRLKMAFLDRLADLSGKMKCS